MNPFPGQRNGIFHFPAKEMGFPFLWSRLDLQRNGYFHFLAKEMEKSISYSSLSIAKRNGKPLVKQGSAVSGCARNDQKK